MSPSSSSSAVPTWFVPHLTPHRSLPGNSRLFLDYLDQPEKLSQFYPGLSSHTLTIEALRDLAPKIAAEHPDRDLLVAALHDQNARWGATAATLDNIAKLADRRTVAIVGGQQTGLFGGEAMNVYKVITILRLARDLSAAGVPAVPVFWIATEDHDFAEVSHTAVVSKDGVREEIRYAGEFPTKPSVGRLNIGPEIEPALERLAELLPESEFSTDIVAGLRDAYRSGSGWSDAFAVWITRLFSRFGLILADPLDPRMRKLAKPALETALNCTGPLAADVLERSKALVAAGYHAQVHTDLSQAFLMVEVDGNRSALVHSDGHFTVKHDPSHGFTVRDLARMLDEEPLRITPNALLRPFVQDVIFPTVAQVLGPAELAYVAQSQPIYDHIGRTAPIRWPRASATIVERKHMKTLEKYGLTLTDTIEGDKALMHRLLTGSLADETAKLFDETQELFTSQLDKLQQALRESDPPLADALTRGREKIFHQLNGLQTRFLDNRAKADATTRCRIERAVAALYPNRGKQERDINLVTFLARYGNDLIDQLHAEMRITPANHQWLVMTA